MRMYDIILNKRNGNELSAEEIEFFVSGVSDGTIPDYQSSALLMAIFFNKMTSKETAILTQAMAKSGDMVDLSPISGIKADKHSTGGVGDKTTLVIAPVVAALGVKVAKMSGRGLGHTGGTVDKLESIPGFKTAMSMDEFFSIVNKTGICVIGQSGALAPADKKLYALRDVTATVDNISLIAASIMSKKLASGSDAILLDVKCGSGAFMKEVDDAIALAREMVDIGTHAGRKCIALITDMDIPLGQNIGNSLEVIEAIDVLSGFGPDDLREECISLSAEMMVLAGLGDTEKCRELAIGAIDSGKAKEKFIEMCIAQGGDGEYILNTDKFAKASIAFEIKSTDEGYIAKMDTEKCGNASVLLGAGRVDMNSVIDHSAGIKILKKTGDFVKSGETLAILYTNDKTALDGAAKLYFEGIIFGEKPKKRPLVLARVDANSIIKN